MSSTFIKIILGLILALLVGIIFILPGFLKQETQFKLDEATGDIHQTIKTWNSETVHLASNDVSTIKSGWQNYLDSDGLWKDIDNTPTRGVTSFLIDQGPFTLELPFTSDGTANMVNNNRYNIHNRVIIDEPAVTMSITAEGGVPTVGVIEQGPLTSVVGTQETTWIRYPNWRIGEHLIYLMRKGVAPRLSKLIQFDSRPTQCTNRNKILERSFIYDFDGVPTIKQHTSNSKNTRDLVSKLDILEGEKISFDFSEERGFSFSPAYLWDSNNDYISDALSVRNKIEIKTSYELVAGGIRQIKYIPCSFFFNSPTFPVFTDTESSFIPDADTETTSVDGRIQSTAPNAWNTAHDETSGGSAADAETEDTFAFVWTNGSLFQIRRGIFVFDTAALPDTDTIDSATVELYVTSVVDTDNDAQAYATIVDSSPASNTAVVAGDYDGIGDAIDNPTKLSDDLDLTGLSTTAYNVWTLNASGLAAISATGVTKLGIREGHDIEDIAVNVGPPITGFAINTADNGSNEPTLKVTHSAAGGGGGGGGVNFLQVISRLLVKEALAI